MHHGEHGISHNTTARTAPMMATWRTTDPAFPRTTGNPAAAQALVPPVTE